MYNVGTIFQTYIHVVKSFVESVDMGYVSRICSYISTF